MRCWLMSGATTTPSMSKQPRGARQQVKLNSRRSRSRNPDSLDVHPQRRLEPSDARRTHADRRSGDAPAPAEVVLPPRREPMRQRLALVLAFACADHSSGLSRRTTGNRSSWRCREGSAERDASADRAGSMPNAVRVLMRGSATGTLIIDLLVRVTASRRSGGRPCRC